MVIFPSSPEYQNGLLNPDRYRFLATFGAIVIAAVILICCWGTRDQIPHLHVISDEKEQLTVTSYFQELWALLKNRSFLAISVCWLILATTGGILGVVFTYSHVYAFEFSTEVMTISRFVGIPGILLALPLVALITKWLDKKYTMLSTGYASLFFIGLPVTLRLVGFFPDNSSAWLIPAFFGIMGIAYTLMPIVGSWWTP